MNQTLPAVTPGEILRKEFMEPVGMSIRSLSKKSRISPEWIQRILDGRSQIGEATAGHLSSAFGNSADFWLNLQSNYDQASRK